MKRNAAIIVAAGNGARMGSDIPKQYQSVDHMPMVMHSFEAFRKHPAIQDIIVVIGADHEEIARKSIPEQFTPVFVKGGATRRESVANGLSALAKIGGIANVLIHDAARPGLHPDVIDRLITALNSHVGAVPALSVVDSLARGEVLMGDTVDRKNLMRIQTPQAFHFEEILKAHRNWNAQQEATDDARMISTMGGKIAIVDGDEALAKYTFPSDFDTYAKPTKQQMIRTGTGFDVHRLVEGEDLWLCGVKIEHSHGLSGHSDADVAIHALVDAILGALALGDIGDHFPPSEPQWRGASSDRFLDYAVKLIHKAGYALSNVDITIICEAPKIGPHRAIMRERLAEIMNVQLSQISVKATTTERLGFTGRGEGIAAQTNVTLMQEKHP